MSKTIPAISIESQLLIKRLSDVAIGEVIEYGTLSEVCGRDVRKNGGSSLHTARRRLQADSGMVFSPVRGIGLKRLSDSEKITDVLPSGTKRISSAARRLAKVALSVQDFDSLPKEQKVQHNTYVSLLGAIGQACTPQRVAKLASRVESAQEKLPLEKTLAALSGK